MKIIKKFGFAFIALMLAVIFIMFVFLLSGMNKVFHLKADLSANGIFKLSQATKEVLDSLDEEVTFYYLSEENRESAYINEVLGRYESSGKNIRVETVDIIKNPMFINKYNENNEAVDKGSIIVECKERFTIINPEASMKIQTSSDGSGVKYSMGFELEKQLTNAIDFVVSDKTVSVGYVSSHESADFTLASEMLEGENISVSQTELTDDIKKYDVIILFGIQKDITEDEEHLLREYLSAGKGLCIVSNPGISCPKLYKIAADYGIEINSNILSEGDPSKVIYNEKHSLESELGEYKITENIKEKKVLMPFASSLTIKEGDSCTVTELLKTGKTTRAYKVEDNKETEFIKADSYCVSAISEKADSSKVLVISTTQMLNTANETLKTAIASADYVNDEFFAQSVKYMADPDGRFISVLPKSIASRSIAITSAQKSVLIVVFGCVLPALVLLAGVIVYLRRRNL